MPSSWTGCMCSCRFAQIDRFCSCCEGQQPLPVLGYNREKKGEKSRSVWWYENKEDGSYIRLQTLVGCKGKFNFIMGSGSILSSQLYKQKCSPQSLLQYFTAILAYHIHLDWLILNTLMDSHNIPGFISTFHSNPLFPSLFLLARKLGSNKCCTGMGWTNLTPRGIW